MPTFIMLTRVEPEALRSPRGVEVLERVAMSAVRAECPEVEWVESYALLGPYDYLDIFRAPDIETATKVATLVRIGGHAHTEVWAATEWTRYKAMVREMPDIGTVISVTG
ncbi:MAG TPA: GYD domain-containing protein [Gemmatimonadales bacterium]|nr:GYD domain-containing protein [Gemmatimonadales bacterium]